VIVSVKVMTWVWSHSTAKGIDRLVLLAIADSAEDDGRNAWPSVDTLSRKCAVDQRTVQRSILRLADLGELGYCKGGGRGHSTVYTVTMPDTAKQRQAAGVTAVGKGGRES
jgi:hypothetical protein